MTEKMRRFWGGAEADAFGRGGVALVAAATGMAISTVRKGRDELRGGASKDVFRVRRKGAGRKRLEEKDPRLLKALETLLDPATRGDPESPLRWTSKSTRGLARELTCAGHPVSASKVAQLVRGLGFSLQGTSKMKEGKSHPERDAQFAHINTQAKGFIARNIPVISVDTKKKEAIGEYSNSGREWRPKGKPVEVLTYDFQCPSTPKAIPYGIYDVAANSGFVNVGIDHDTPIFAVHSIERWWQLMGSIRYPGARELFITADAGGSNSRKSNVWKAQLQAMADRYRLKIHVSHFPPGTSKWNKIEHRLFSFISLNWRGRPLTSYETVVSLIAATTTRKGLTVTAELDNAKYPIGIKVEKHKIDGLSLEHHAFQGIWNYTLHPRTPEELTAIDSQPDNAARSRSRAARRARWVSIFTEQLRSGKSISAFCRDKGINRRCYLEARARILGTIQSNSRRAD